MLTYAQEKSGKKLHLAFTYNGRVSHPICGRKVNGYRMTINVPLANACQNCCKITADTIKRKEKEFLLGVLANRQ